MANLKTMWFADIFCILLYPISPWPLENRLGTLAVASAWMCKMFVPPTAPAIIGRLWTRWCAPDASRIKRKRWRRTDKIVIACFIERCWKNWERFYKIHRNSSMLMIWIVWRHRSLLLLVESPRWKAWGYRSQISRSFESFSCFFCCSPFKRRQDETFPSLFSSKVSLAEEQRNIHIHAYLCIGAFCPRRQMWCWKP